MHGYCACIYTSLTMRYYNGGKNKMTSTQRMKSDMATRDRREMTDITMREDRIRNDELTMERRFKADEAVEESRLKNDEATANRREVKDGHSGMALPAFLLILIILAIGALIIFV